MLRMKPDDFFCRPQAKPRIIDSLERAADKMVAEHDDRRVCFGFIGDVYCNIQRGHDVTRQALDVMVDRGLNFEVCTKGGTKVERDFDLLKCGGRLGVSMVWDVARDSLEWEPNAPTVDDRSVSLMNAHEEGIYTWLSVEPVLKPRAALDVIENVQPWVNEFRVGKINHNKRLEEGVDWQEFTDDVYVLLLETGRSFVIKESLWPYLRGKEPRVCKNQ